MPRSRKSKLTVSAEVRDRARHHPLGLWVCRGLTEVNEDWQTALLDYPELIGLCKVD